MLENEIENYAVNLSKELGYLVFKLKFIGYTGSPDRLYISPNGVILFIEFKAPGKKAKKRQGFVHQLLKQWKQKVYVLDSKEKAKKVLLLHAA